MALIYASAVNRRMNALHKKNSVDYPPSAHSHISSQHSHNGHEIVHCKQRSNEERVVVGQQQQQQQSRESSLDIGHDRKRSAPPQIANRGGGANAQQQQANSNTTANGINGNSHNGSNANLDSPLTMQKHQQPQQQLRQQHKKSGEHQKQPQQPAGRACRKTTVSNDGQLFRPSPELLAHHQQQHRHQPRRKISTPVMAQSVNGTLTMGGGGGGGGGGGRFADGGRFGKGGGGGGNNGKKSHHKTMTAMAHSRDSPSSGCSSFEVDEEEGSPPLYGGPKGLLASFGRAIRRRSVSADNVVFRRRNGTNSSLDSSDNGSPAGASGGGRKSSAFQKMKERLNKWKLSG